MYGVEPFLFALRRTNGQVVEKGAVGTPREEVLLGDIQGHFAVLVGLVAAPVLGDGHASGPDSRPDIYRTAGLVVWTLTVTVRAS